MKGITHASLEFVAFIQATALTFYCSLIALLIWRGNTWFGRMPSYLGSFLFLVLFTTSALISGLITLGYPFLLFWQQKQTVKALRLVAYTAGWLLFYTLCVVFILIFT